MESYSVQSFFNLLLQQYGEGDVRLGKDLLLSGDQHCASLLHQAKKFVAVQYVIGQMSKKQRHLWCVQGGEGKSIIAATTSDIAFWTGMTGKIYIIYE